MEAMEAIGLTWCEVDAEAYFIANCIKERYPTFSKFNLYGIPRGGIIPACLVQKHLEKDNILVCLVMHPEKADIFIDDIVATGETRKKYQTLYPGKPFYQITEKDLSAKSVKWVVFPWERMNSEEDPSTNIVRLLEYIGENPKREGLIETPARVIRSYKTLFGGYQQDPKDVMKVFEDDACKEMVLVKNIELYSTCEHHMLPFYGRCHVAYIPDGRVLGISKLVRVVEIYARRLQLQERLCEQITAALDEHLKPLGSACVIEAQHFCMTSRGVQKQHSEMVTSSLTGVFKEEPIVRSEFMGLIRR